LNGSTAKYISEELN